MRTLDRIESAEARFVETWWRQKASALMRLARTLRAREMLLEDWVVTAAPRHEDKHFQALLRRWPTAKARDAIVWAAKKAGVPLRLIPASYDIAHCPACGADTHEDDRGNICCNACDARGSRDTIAAWNMFRKAGVDPTQMVKLAKLADNIAQEAKQTARSKANGRSRKVDGRADRGTSAASS
jgi:transposase